MIYTQVTVVLYTRRINQDELHSNIPFGASCRHELYVSDGENGRYKRTCPTES